MPKLTKRAICYVRTDGPTIIIKSFAFKNLYRKNKNHKVDVDDDIQKWRGKNANIHARRGGWGRCRAKLNSALGTLLFIGIKFGNA